MTLEVRSLDKRPQGDEQVLLVILEIFDLLDTLRKVPEAAVSKSFLALFLWDEEYALLVALPFTVAI